MADRLTDRAGGEPTVPTPESVNGTMTGAANGPADEPNPGWADETAPDSMNSSTSHRDGEHTSPRRMTAADVGRAAGVSAATVSLVLNGKAEGRVTPETADRVRAAAKRLGYRIDRRGQSLATGRSGLIGFVAPDTANPFFGSVQMGVLHALGSAYQVLLMATDVGQGVARKNVEELISLGVDGMIL
ncbi:MAG: LacI family DNA-binding transcriptional regulator, partial [Acidothermaceae bacterium]